MLGEESVPYICCCTAYVEASFKKNAISAGMDHFLTKPIKQSDLEKILELLE